mmetsp:Transcript_103147/g.321440  ORF Transcript_103147/g.321440 Transcript_103147/m.321440 type:complete len:412 (+) Transcript_103147:74-1309(+)
MPWRVGLRLETVDVHGKKRNSQCCGCHAGGGARPRVRARGFALADAVPPASALSGADAGCAPPDVVILPGAAASFHSIVAGLDALCQSLATGGTQPSPRGADLHLGAAGGRVRDSPVQYPHVARPTWFDLTDGDDEDIENYDDPWLCDVNPLPSMPAFPVIAPDPELGLLLSWSPGEAMEPAAGYLEELDDLAGLLLACSVLTHVGGSGDMKHVVVASGAEVPANPPDGPKLAGLAEVTEDVPYIKDYSDGGPNATKQGIKGKKKNKVKGAVALKEQPQGTGDVPDPHMQAGCPPGMCRHFRMGRCWYGSQCRFVHSKDQDETITGDACTQQDAGAGTSDCAISDKTAKVFLAVAAAGDERRAKLAMVRECVRQLKQTDVETLLEGYGKSMQGSMAAVKAKLPEVLVDDRG